MKSKVVEKQVIEKLDLQGPNKTIKLIQKRLIELDYLKEFNDDGSRFDEGVIGPATSAAIDAFLLKKGLVGQDRIDILGNEDDPDSWKQLLALLTDQKMMKNNRW
ncbi:MAG: hypothetical protein IPP22_00555 [Nitrosomonas sp.]|nr:hypothetical protein [Nitrosomonas sp.]